VSMMASFAATSADPGQRGVAGSAAAERA
jgi:hypothetical protein